ncbi:MAG: alpha-L-fucosidase C-terminal domain-containing protein [Candidatus Azotimanducaceae bacterium]|uniref:Alpha-L-fucosidase C-terminal domain-containing protein n=1 Tax=OM182 bacterium TaxID=2510334 RepID=A0A520S1Y1_9GAMM|nr:hypothetical protein [Gammaproteobacteria bacterium]OUV67035.1 MAG: hypothetical protein CBC93_06950 [Gammaproteobacteria bacterium TMED133]RZO76469.1 MAG: hypothetical protein EVA68_04085 [OM182 bacterium]
MTDDAGMFSEQHEVLYTNEDYRFTCTDNAIYATCLGWPEGASKTKTMGRLYAKGISSVTMLGSDEQLSWNLSREGLEIPIPRKNYVSMRLFTKSPVTRVFHENNSGNY